MESYTHSVPKVARYELDLSVHSAVRTSLAKAAQKAYFYHNTYF
jgi:hypothetical protein